MRIVVDHLSDEEVRAVADEHGKDPSSYDQAGLAMFKFVQACVASAQDLAEADKSAEDAPLASPSVAEQTGFSPMSRRADDTGPGVGEE